MTSYYREAETQAMIDEFGVAVTISGVTARALVDRMDEEILAARGYAPPSGRALGKRVLVTTKTGAFPGLANEGTATIEGIDYRISDVMQIADGALTRFLAARELSP